MAGTQRITAQSQINPTPREVLAASRTYYVRTDGSDSNDGLTNTAGGAFLTIQHAVDVAAALDTSIYDVTIKVADGSTYAEVVSLKPPVGAGGIIVEGNTTTPANVVLDGNFMASSPNVVFTVKGFKLKRVSVASAFGALYADRDSLIQFQDIEFDTGYTWHMIATGGGKLYFTGNYKVTGGATRHYMVETPGGLIRNAPGVSCTVTIVGNLAFTVFAYALTTGAIIINSSQVTISRTGSPTGQHYNGSLNAVINTAGGGATYFLGASGSAGAVATGAQYA